MLKAIYLNINQLQMKIFQQLVESASKIRDLRSTQSFVRIMLVFEVATFSHLQPFFEHLTYYQGFAQTIFFHIHQLQTMYTVNTLLFF